MINDTFSHDNDTVKGTLMEISKSPYVFVFI